MYFATSILSGRSFPELVTAGLIFRSRIRVLLNFMKFLYLDKKDRVRAMVQTRSRHCHGISRGL